MKRMSTAAFGWVVALGLLWAPSAQSAEKDAEAFYKGLRNMKMVISSAPGGSYDTYARLLARHIGNQIPGKPSLISINVPGASGIKAANYVIQQAPHDGSILTNPRQNFPMYQALDNLKRMKGDVRDFHWIGSYSATNRALAVYYKSPVKTLDQAKTTQVLIGAASPKSFGALMSRIYNEFLGTKLKVVTGYGGIARVKLAMQRGEVEGLGSNGWADLQSDFGDLLRENQLNILVQVGLEKEPDLPKVPLLIDLATNPEERAVFEFIAKSTTSMGKPFATSPGVPADRVALLRAAFDATMKDAKFLKDANRQHVQIRPISGAAVQQMVADVIAAPKSVTTRMKKVLKIKKGQAIQ